MAAQYGATKAFAPSRCLEGDSIAQNCAVLEVVVIAISLEIKPNNTQSSTLVS